MGVLNVTPDSFSDGGLYVDEAAAVARGLDLMAAGADVVDVGGESSRPGAEPVPLDVELQRVVPVVAALAGRRGGGRGVRLSVDTVKPEVAAAALAAGATLVNDISASLFEVAAAGRRRVGGHAHAGLAPDHAGGPALRRRRCRGAARSCSSGPAWPGRPGWARSGSIPASGSARPWRTT